MIIGFRRRAFIPSPGEQHARNNHGDKQPVPFFAHIHIHRRHPDAKSKRLRAPDTSRVSEGPKRPCRAGLLHIQESNQIRRKNRSASGRRPEPQTGTVKLLRDGWNGRQNGEKLGREIGEGQNDGCFDPVLCRLILPPIRRREMLELRGTHRRAVTRRSRNFQAAPRARRRKERIEKQKRSDDQTHPAVPT
jgi:hypothetical protein